MADAHRLNLVCSLIGNGVIINSWCSDGSELSDMCAKGSGQGQGMGPSDLALGKTKGQFEVTVTLWQSRE